MGLSLPKISFLCQLTLGNSNRKKEYYHIKMDNGYEWYSEIWGLITDIKNDYIELNINMQNLSKTIGVERDTK